MILTKRKDIKELINEIVSKLDCDVKVNDSYYGRFIYNGRLIEIHKWRHDIGSLKGSEIIYDGDFSDEEMDKYFKRLGVKIGNRNPVHMTLNEFYINKGVISEEVA